VDAPLAVEHVDAWAQSLFGLPWGKVLDIVESVDAEAAMRLRMTAAEEPRAKAGRPKKMGNPHVVRILATLPSISLPA
jgi:hypothetical protein